MLVSNQQKVLRLNISKDTKMFSTKTEVFSTYDTQYQTWNVLDMNNQCLFYGTIDGLEEWLDENKDKYHERLH